MVANVFLDSHQLEEVRRCYMRLLDWPRKLAPAAHVNALHGMARYHKERKEWVEVIEFGEEALRFIPDAKKQIHVEEMLLIVLADAAEGQGDMPRAREYDKKAKTSTSRAV